MIDWPAIADSLIGVMMLRPLTDVEQRQLYWACERMESSAEPVTQWGDWTALACE